MLKVFTLSLIVFLVACAPPAIQTPKAGTNGDAFYTLIKQFGNAQSSREYCGADDSAACELSREQCPKPEGRYDIGQNCSSMLKIGIIGDRCSGLPTEKSVVGTLGAGDVDLFEASYQDNASLFCDLFRDSFSPSLSLVSAPPGVILCVMPFTTNSCQNLNLNFNLQYCSGTRWQSPGSYGVNNSQTVLAWLIWHPQAPASCTSYEVVLRGTSP